MHRPARNPRDQLPKRSVTYGACTAIFVKTDVSEAPDVRRLVQSIVEQFVRESLNNRGPRLVHETDESTYTKNMDDNAKSVFLGCKYAVEQFRRQNLDSAGNKYAVLDHYLPIGLEAAWVCGFK
ncbi:hypothetical protein N7497_000169 [Penicillium chrysogenum]|uniref:Uncharacterized protein n=1 Tax=Penicillium chrysogenum TaxID=5076 RepID=A0ABQ8X003_PENCH|nr:hypothetical protein N7505_002523 [Penicillium chrysogenum]KAJ6167326.1 hypothetical protein N7497_000169 [Penicillium chrysogenum]